MAIKSKKVKVSARERNKFRIRRRVTGSAERPRLTVYRSGRHTYAQAVEDLSGKTLCAASTAEDTVQKRAADAAAMEGVELFTNDTKSTKSMRAAFAVGLVIAERLKGLSKGRIVFDRNGNIYHGRIKAVAEGARKGGLEF